MQVDSFIDNETLNSWKTNIIKEEIKEKRKAIQVRLHLGLLYLNETQFLI